MKRDSTLTKVNVFFSSLRFFSLERTYTSCSATKHLTSFRYVGLAHCTLEGTRKKRRKGRQQNDNVVVMSFIKKIQGIKNDFWQFVTRKKKGLYRTWERWRFPGSREQNLPKFVSAGNFSRRRYWTLALSNKRRWNNGSSWKYRLQRVRSPDHALIHLFKRG